MSHLSQLLDGATRQAVINDVAQLIDTVVAEQSGITGMAIKGAVSAAKKTDANVLSKVVAQVFPDVLGELEPTWQEFEASGQSDFAAFVEPRSEQIAGSIMNIADNKSQQVNNGAFLKAYNALRGKAVKIVTPHVPALARTLAAHM